MAAADAVLIQYLASLTPEQEADIDEAEALDAVDDGRSAPAGTCRGWERTM